MRGVRTGNKLSITQLKMIRMCSGRHVELWKRDLMGYLSLESALNFGLQMLAPEIGEEGRSMIAKAKYFPL